MIYSSSNNNKDSNDDQKEFCKRENFGINRISTTLDYEKYEILIKNWIINQNHYNKVEYPQATLYYPGT